MLVVSALAGGCATAERAPDPGAGMIGAAPETPRELPGVVLSGRHGALGGQFHVTVAASDSAAARAALEAAFSVGDSIEGLMSLYVAGSEVNRINAAAGREPVQVSPWTEQVVAATLEWAEKSEGAFDPTVGPVADLWGFGRSATPTPDVDSLAAAKRLVGWQKVRHDPAVHTVYLTLAGMVLDLRSANKGFALDRMREAMVAEGATSGIAEIGGDMLFFGPGTGPTPDRWSISLPDPYEPGSSYVQFNLPPGSVSTSAALNRAIVIRGERFGHLIDPRTGRPVQGLASVSVYSPNGMTSDIAATALYVLGSRDGPKYVARWADVDAVFVTEPPAGNRSVVIVTSGLDDYQRMLDTPYRPATAEER
ncbi:FAD:protein FMN transferase [soil metagenome]